MANITLLFPTRNEEKTIVEVIQSFRDELTQLGHQITEIIITDDSRDNTREVAISAGVTIVIGGGHGLGAAMYRGLKHAVAANPDLIISADSDGQVDPKELEEFINTALNENYDLVIGSRFLNKDLVHYNYKFINRTGIRILVWILNRLTKLNLTDSHGGMRAIKPDVVKNLELIGTHTYVQETIIDAVEKGFKVKEIPSKWLKREHGSSRIVSSIPKYIFYTLPVLILRSGQHIRFLFPLGIFFIMLSFLDFLLVGIEINFSPFEFMERQSFHLILLLLTIGINMILFGFAIEMIANIKKTINRYE